MDFFNKMLLSCAWGILCASQACAVDNESLEVLSLDVISYEDFVQSDASAMSILEKALHEKGIVGIRGVPGYKEKARAFIDAARSFSALPEEVKEKYAPRRDLGDFLGYEVGREKFRRPDGNWFVDDLKVSYYAYVPDDPLNKWPAEVDVKGPFQELGAVMSQMGEAVMEKIGLIGPRYGVCLDGIPRVGRMLYYRKSAETVEQNPFWCEAHFDHGIFTALIPATYFVDGEEVPEPVRAGLFVKTTAEGHFRKVVADDPEVLLFQVGEFGQLITDDDIRATEHRVHKAQGNVERYAMALFFVFNASRDFVVHSTSELTQDSRYGGSSGDPCSYMHWHEESLNRYHAKTSTN